MDDSLREKTIYIHIGHGKTGTSYIQSLLAGNVASLSDHGIDYPADDEELRLAAEGNISSGNGFPLIDLLWRFHNEGVQPSVISGSVLYSSELLFFLLTRPRTNELLNVFEWMSQWLGVDPEERVKALVRWAKAQGAEKIKLLLFTRNPVGCCESCYQQAVKRGGLDDDISEYMETVNMVEPVAWLLECVQKEPMIELTTYNYSVVKKRLQSIVSEWLQLSTPLVDNLPVATVNRSMTLPELMLQRQLNRTMGAPCGGLLSDLLCEKLPDIKAQKFIPKQEIQQAYWKMLLPDVERANRHLDVAQHYTFDESPPTLDNGEYTFNLAQLEVIAEGLGGEIVNLNNAYQATLSDLRNQQDEMQRKTVLHEQEMARLQSGIEQANQEKAQLQKFKERCTVLETKCKEQKESLNETSRALNTCRKELKVLKERPKLPWYKKMVNGERWSKRYRRWFNRS